MMAMYDNPDGLHRLMRFLADGALAFTAWLESEGLYTLNNEDDYIGSGTTGHTRDLPATGSEPTRPARQDLWCLSESQETSGRVTKLAGGNPLSHGAPERYVHFGGEWAPGPRQTPTRTEDTPHGPAGFVTRLRCRPGARRSEHAGERGRHYRSRAPSR